MDIIFRQLKNYNILYESDVKRIKTPQARFRCVRLVAVPTAAQAPAYVFVSFESLNIRFGSFLITYHDLK